MPEPITYQDISITDFKTALSTFLNAMEAKWRKDRGVWEGFAQAILWEEDADDYNKRMYDEVMTAVEQYGISPEVVNALSPQAADIFNTVFSRRVRYDWELKSQKAMEQYQKELADAADKLWRYERDNTEFQQRQSNWEREFQFAQEKWEFEKGQRLEATGLERARLGIQVSQAMNEKELATSVRRAAGAQEMTQFLGQAGAERERDIRLEERQRFAKLFEEERTRLLGGTAPSDWFIREQAKSAPNPFAGTESIGQDIGQYRAELTTAKSRVADAASRFKALSSRVIDAADPIEGAELLRAKEQYDQVKYVYDELRARQESTERVLARAESSPEAQWAKPRAIQGGNFEVGAPEAPRKTPAINIPPELTKAFGVKAFGQPIETPTAGQWGQATSTAQQQYIALLRAYGKDPEEALLTMARSIPKNPSLRSRWSVARQMA